MLRTSVVGLLVVALACGGAPVDPAPLAAPDSELVERPRAMEQPRTFVSVLGTVHRTHLSGGYPLSVVEGALRNFEPDVVFVELPPDALEEVLIEVDSLGAEAVETLPQGPWVRELPELYEVVLPLRHELGYEVVPVSGWTTASRRAREAYYEEHPHGPMERDYLIANATFHATFLENRGYTNPAFIHQSEYRRTISDASRWLSYFAEEAMGLGGELRVLARHAALVEDALAAHRGARILVVFDATACWYLEGVIAQRREVVLAPTGAFLP